MQAGPVAAAPACPQRVLLAHPSPDLYGSDRMLVESVRALRATGCEVTVALPGPGPLVPALRACGAVVRFVPMAVLRRSQLSPAGLAGLAARGVRTLLPMLWAIRSSRADVIVVNTLTVPGWLLAAKLSRRPVLCHVHEAEDALRRPVALALHMPLLLADRVVANSVFAAERIRAALPRLAGRMTVVYNGVAGPPEPAGPPPPPDRPAQLLLVGRLSPRKGSDVAVAATKLLRDDGTDVRLTLLGEVFTGYEAFETELRERAAELPGLVEFAGFHADVWPWFAAADIVLVPSRMEPFGNVAVEAALARRPVIASAVQGLPEIVADGLTGSLVAPDEPAALAAAVSRLLADWPRAVAMAAAAHTDARTRFGADAYAAQLIEAIRAVMPAGG